MKDVFSSLFTLLTVFESHSLSIVPVYWFYSLPSRYIEGIFKLSKTHFLLIFLFIQCALLDIYSSCLFSGEKLVNGRFFGKDNVLMVYSLVFFFLNNSDEPKFTGVCRRIIIVSSNLFCYFYKKKKKNCSAYPQCLLFNHPPPIYSWKPVVPLPCNCGLKSTTPQSQT